MGQVSLSELVTAAATDAGISQAAGDRFIKNFFESIKQRIKKGDKVTLHGFGIFTKTHRAARAGRNPQTGETLKIKASNSVGFKPAKPFKDALN